MRISRLFKWLRQWGCSERGIFQLLPELEETQAKFIGCGGDYFEGDRNH
jgi:hypothetical protein